jgi:hypothetical protein
LKLAFGVYDAFWRVWAFGRRVEAFREKKGGVFAPARDERLPFGVGRGHDAPQSIDAEERVALSSLGTFT